MVFPVVMYRYERWTRKKAERWQIDAFEMWYWRRLLRVPWTAKRSDKPVRPKGNQPWIFIGRTDADAEAPILWRCFYWIGMTVYFCLNLPSFWRCWSQEHSLINLFPGPPWWLRGKESACLMRETRVRSLIWEDATCRRQLSPELLGLCSSTREPPTTESMCCNYWRPCTLGPMLRNKRSPRPTTREKPRSSEGPAQPGTINKIILKNLLPSFSQMLIPRALHTQISVAVFLLGKSALTIDCPYSKGTHTSEWSVIILVMYFQRFRQNAHVCIKQKTQR